jgi:hypothetical protein
MLFFLTIFVVILAALAVAFAARRSRQDRILPDYDPLNIDASQFRPLFAPTEEDLAQVEREKQATIDADHEHNNRLEYGKKLANFTEFRQTWRASVNKVNTVELLTRAAEFQNGGLFLETVNVILDERRERHVADMTDKDLAQLIESHFWLLPANERTPGVTYTINQELKALQKPAR